MKNSKLLLTFTSSLLLLTTLSLMTSTKPDTFFVKGNENGYDLTLSNSTNKISDTTRNEEFSSTIHTTYNNDITINGYNVSNYNEGWQTLLPKGYFYNPVTQVGNNNKISGIKSINYVGSANLELHYGYSLDNEHIIYSLEDTLVSNVTFEFNDEHPSYIYIKNNSNNNIDIDEIVFNYSCQEQTYPRQDLKILMIGNSFADDTVFYARRIANSFGINIEIRDAYIGGCTINSHYNNIRSGEALYSMRSTNESGTWVYNNNMSLGDIVTFTDWDIITFQQASAEVGRVGTYENLTNLVNEVKDRVTGTPKYYWHQTWAYDQDYSEYNDYFSYFNNDSDTMFNALVERYHAEVETTGLFEKTIYNGTAVQNMRTSYMGDTFSRDGKHMSLVHGRYLLSSNFISIVYNIDFELSPVSYRPDGLSTNYQKVVNESIKNARLHPDSISSSSYTTTEIDEYDLSTYTEIDAGLVGCSYWNCTDPNKYNLRNNHVEGTSNKYASSKRFTPETLPAGSLVFVKEGLGYRPEAWVNDEPNYNRKPEEYNKVLEITDSWWEGYQYRAFNIFKPGKQDLSAQYVDEQYDDIFDGFRIFVPNDKLNASIKVKSENSSYGYDLDNFTAHGLDIDDYDRVHMYPITGFYLCSELYSLFNKYVDDTAQRFICTRPFTSIPEGTVVIIDSGYQWRSDCWGSHGTYSPRPDNVSTNFTVIDSSFMSSFRRRTFNISRTDGYTKVGQNSNEFMNHFRMYIPK